VGRVDTYSKLLGEVWREGWMFLKVSWWGKYKWKRRAKNREEKYTKSTDWEITGKSREVSWNAIKR
jgi:hypothetical protein